MENEIEQEDVMIYHSKRTNRYYTDGDIKCSYCGEKLIDAFIFIFKCSKKYNEKKYVCIKCFGEIDSVEYLWNQRNAVIITKYLPKDAIPIISWTPSLSDAKNLSVFALNEINSDTTTNKTRYSNTPSINSVLIGDRTVVDKYEDIKLNLPQTMNYLDNIKTWKPIDDLLKIENQKIKQLEIKGDDTNEKRNIHQ